MATAPYDPLTDFATVARVGEAPLLMVISPNLPQGKIKEVVDAAKQNPEKWTAGLPALGAAAHLGTLMFAQQGGLNLATAVYKGTAPALTDVAGGHAQILIDSIISLQSMAKSGKVKPIVVTSRKRSAVMPNVPTAVESGFPKFVTESWYGIWAPKGTPDDLIQFLHKAANDAVQQLDKAKAFEPLGIDPVIETIEESRKYIQGYVAESAELRRAQASSRSKCTDGLPALRSRWLFRLDAGRLDHLGPALQFALDERGVVLASRLGYHEALRLAAGTMVTSAPVPWLLPACRPQLVACLLAVTCRTRTRLRNP